MKKMFIFGLFFGVLLSGQVFPKNVFYAHSYDNFRREIKNKILPETNLNTRVKDYLDALDDYGKLTKQITQKQALNDSGARKKGLGLEAEALLENFLGSIDDLESATSALGKYMFQKKIWLVSCVKISLVLDGETSRSKGRPIFVENEEVLKKITIKGLEQDYKKYERELRDLKSFLEKNKNYNDSSVPFFDNESYDEPDLVEESYTSVDENKADYEALNGFSFGSFLDVSYGSDIRV
ncbi:MAG: hypothetical protein ABH827_03630 [bacterium]